MTEKHLYLIDGHALAYRSYFATIRAPMTNSKGRPTGALFGFTNAILALLQNYQCPYVAVVFDSAEPTFRHEIYKEYKANREIMPDDMQVQMPLILEVVDCLKIARISRGGLEADDILAVLVKKAVAAGFSVSLVTKDKDLMQLVGGSVRMLAPESGGKMVEMGHDDVLKKMGVIPGKIRDLLALMGDSSDNIPGVPGVGPKTAVKILEKAGSIDNLLRNPSCLENENLQAKIEENRENILVSMKLATLKDDAEFNIDLESLKARGPDREACIRLFTGMDFNSLLKNPLFASNKTIDFTVKTAAGLDDLKEIVAGIKRAQMVSIDTETTSTVPREARLVGISCAVEPSRAWYIPVGHLFESNRNIPVDSALSLLAEVVESEKIVKIGQNLKYDYQIFRNYGLTMRGIVFDTMIAGYCLEPGKRQYGLDAMARQWLQAGLIPIDSLIGKKGAGQKSFAEVPIDDAARYSGEDAVVPLLLKKKFDPLLDEKNLRTLFQEIEIPLVSVLAEMEWQGIVIDRELLSRFSGEYGEKLREISAEIYALAGGEFNLNSPKQIGDVLFTKMKLPKSRKTKTGLSTDVDALEKLAPQYPIAAKLLEYREIQKLLSTYIDALPSQISAASGRVHSSFNQTVTTTGRLSSNNPNLQNIPIRSEAGIRIREAFVAPRGFVLVSADYSQIELRVLAHLSGDEMLCRAFHENRDIHTRTASAIYGIFPEMVTPDMRRAAKTINFGLIYGMGPVNLSRQLSISFSEAQQFIDTYFEQFPSIRKFMDACIADTRRKGYCETMFGRRRDLPDIDSDRRQIREAAERAAINTPVQGSAADIIKIAMIAIQKDMSGIFENARLLLQVHDELVFEVAQDDAERLKQWVVEKMSSAHGLSVPLKVDAGIGKNWREAH